LICEKIGIYLKLDFFDMILFGGDSRNPVGLIEVQ
jgi:hypothetical protein